MKWNLFFFSIEFNIFSFFIQRKVTCIRFHRIHQFNMIKVRSSSWDSASILLMKILFQNLCILLTLLILLCLKPTLSAVHLFVLKFFELREVSFFLHSILILIEIQRYIEIFFWVLEYLKILFFISNQSIREIKLVLLQLLLHQSY